MVADGQIAAPDEAGPRCGLPPSQECFMVLFSPEFCEKTCPVCTRAARQRVCARRSENRNGPDFRRLPLGRGAQRKYGVPPTEPLPLSAAPSQSPAAPAQPADSTAITTPPRSGRPNPG